MIKALKIILKNKQRNKKTKVESQNPRTNGKSKAIQT